NPPVQFVVKNRDFESLVQGMDALVARANAIPGLLNVDTDLRVTKPELVVTLDRDRAEDLGVPARDVALTLQTLLGGRDVSRFTSDNKLYDVILRLDPRERSTPSDIAGLHVRGRDGQLVALDALTRIEERVGPRQLNHHDRVRSSFLMIGGFMGPPSSALIGPLLEDWDERDRSAEDIISEVQPKLFFGVPGVFAFASNPPAFGGFTQPVQFVVKHRDFEALVQGMDALVGRASQIPGLVNVDTDLRVTKPELVVTLDRDRAEDLGVPARDIASTLQTMLGGRDVTRFTSDNKLYDVILRLDPAERSTPSDISGLQVRGRGGARVQLDAVTRVEERVGPRQLNHHNRVRSFTLSASMLPGFALGEALDSLTRAATEVLPPGSTIDLAGESRELKESGTTLYFAFAFALVFVFMVLAAQFESLVHPFTVMLAVPLAVTGALAALVLAGSTLNVYSQVGMILLIGLVTKNSILLVTYANDLRGRGHDPVAAMREAGRIRLRPILMT
ncbi:MAG: efflux RND transporter permease subunit, partial [Gemmatimonadales bacterium]